MKTLREQFTEETGKSFDSLFINYIQWLESKLESSQLSEDITEKIAWKVWADRIYAQFGTEMPLFRSKILFKKYWHNLKSSH